MGVEYIETAVGIAHLCSVTYVHSRRSLWVMIPTFQSCSCCTVLRHPWVTLGAAGTSSSICCSNGRSRMDHAPCFGGRGHTTPREGRLAVICLSGAMGAMYTDAHTCPPLTPAACCSCSSLQGDPSCSQHSICSLPTVAAEKGKHKKLHLGLGKNSKKAKNSALLATHKSQFICPFVFIEAGREAKPPWKQTCLCCARSQI